MEQSKAEIKGRFGELTKEHRALLEGLPGRLGKAATADETLGNIQSDINNWITRWQKERKQSARSDDQEEQEQIAIEKLERIMTKEQEREQKREQEREQIAAWMLHAIWRERRNQRKITSERLSILRKNLRRLAFLMLPENMFRRLRFYFPYHRRLVVPLHRLMDLPFDLFWISLWAFRLHSFSKDKDRRKLSHIRQLGEILFQGVPFEDALEIAPHSLLPEKGSIFFRRGKAYHYTWVSSWLWAMIKAFFPKNEKAHPEDKQDPNWRRLFHAAMRQSVPPPQNTGGEKRPSITVEEFRCCGLLYKIFAEDLPPYAISHLRQENSVGSVLSPDHFLGKEALIRIPKRRLREEEEEEEPVTESLTWDFIIQLRKRIFHYHDLMEDLPAKRKNELRQRFISELKNEIDAMDSKEEASPPLQKIILEWMKSKLEGRMRPLSASTLLSSLKPVFIYCQQTAKELLSLKEGDYEEILKGDNDQIEWRRLKSMQHTINSLYTFLRLEKGINIRYIRWEKIKRLVVRTPALFVLSDPNKVKRRILRLWRGGEEEKDAAIIGILSRFLGFRRAEIARTKVNHLRLLGDTQEDCLVITEGKGGKFRRIRLKYIPVNLRKILEEAYGRRTFASGEKKADAFLFQATGRGESAAASRVSRVGYLSEKYYKNLMPSGLHSGRRAFVTDLATRGIDPTSISSLCGHATLAVTLGSYDHSAHASPLKYFSDGRVTPRGLPSQWLTMKEAANLLAVSRPTLFHWAKSKILKEPRQRFSERTYRKGGRAEWGIHLERLLQFKDRAFRKRCAKIPLGARLTALMKKR